MTPPLSLLWSTIRVMKGSADCMESDVGPSNGSMVDSVVSLIPSALTG